MIFTYNKQNLKQSKMYLANPQKKYIGVISKAKNLELTINFNTTSEASFTIHEKEDDEYTDYYDKIENKRLIEIQYVGWFQITEVKENNNGVDNFKEVTCTSLEYELTGKRIDDINGVFALYDITDTSKSLMHIIAQESGWGIGHIDNELIGKWRTFSIDTSKVYNLLMTDLSKSFECVFDFDVYAKTISAYKLSNIGKLTDIVISYKNILKEYFRDSTSDKIITKLKIVGDDSVDIRAVNQNGTNYRINLDYFMTLDWVSQSLLDAWNAYKVKYSNYDTQYSTTLALLKTQQAELTVLNASLKDLKSLKTIQEGIMGNSVVLHNGRTPISSDTDYTIYQNAVTLVATYTAQITTKNTEIAVKEDQIVVTNANLDVISADLDMGNNFTTAQIAELNVFITENEEYQDSSFVISDLTTAEEAIEIKQELMANGDAELERASKPQFTVEVTIGNLFAIKDEEGSTTLEDMRKDCDVGNLITIKFGNGNWTTARLISLNIKFDKLDDISLVMSDKSRFDNELIQLGGVIAQAGRTSTSLNLKKYGYDSASSITSEVREFINGTLSATLNAMQSNDNQELLIDAYGLHMRKWLPDQNKYDDHQAWWNNNTLLFSDDGFRSSKTGIGLFTTPSGENIYSVFADVICGTLLMGEALAISNASGTYTINNNGFTATNGIYSVGINPNTPSEIINVKVSGVNKLYVNTTTSELEFTGKIIGSSFVGGSISSSNYLVNNVGMKIDLSTGTIDSKNFKLTSNGSITVTNGIFSGSITSSTINIGSGKFSVDINGNVIAKSIDITGGSFSIGGRFEVDSSGNLTANNASFTNGSFSGDVSASTITGTTITGATMSASTIDGTTITGSTLQSVGENYSTTISNGTISTGYISISQGSYSLTISAGGILVGDTYISDDSISSPIFNGWASQARELHNNRYESSYYAYVSSNDNFISSVNSMYIGSSGSPWAGVYASDDTIRTSDERKKNSIIDLDNRYEILFDNISPRLYKLNEGSSDRLHVGFIAQEVERAMETAGISSQEFAGLVKAPIYQEKWEDGEYNTNSEIIDFDYFLRYGEFVPILAKKIKSLENKILELENIS